MSIRFTPQWKPTTSVRESELERSAQRSHAAREANKKRKSLQLRLAGYGGEPSPIAAQSISPIYQYRRHSESPSFSTPRTVTSPTPQPTTIINRGNSDPFNAFIVEITPSFNRIITFARDSYFPSVTVPRWLRNSARLPDRHAFVFGLSSPDSAVAHVSTYGACLSRILPHSSRIEIEDTCNRLRTQALERLRLQVAAQPEHTPPTQSLVQQVLYLFQGAYEARELTTAKIHFCMLRYLLVALSYNVETIFLFVNAMHTTLDMAVFTLEPEVADFSPWCPKQFQGPWSYAESLLPPKDLEAVHRSISGPLLQDCLLRFRKWLTLSDTIRADSSIRAQDGVIQLWFHTRPVKDCADLLRRFLALLSVPPHPVDRAESVNVDLEAAMTLTLFCTIRKYVHHSLLDDSDIDLRDASYMLAPRLRIAIEALPVSFTSEEQRDHEEVMFWMYFTGALFEQGVCIYQQQMLKSGSGDDDWWFSTRLAQQAMLLELEGWKQAQCLLEKFAYCDILEPPPEAWWDRIFHDPRTILDRRELRSISETLTTPPGPLSQSSSAAVSAMRTSDSTIVTDRVIGDEAEPQ